jgi:hypothetical protein
MIIKVRIIIIILFLTLPTIAHITTAELPSAPNSLITDMIQKINENTIYNTVYTLQNFRTRYYPFSGNKDTSTWIYDQLNNISGLNVEYQNGAYRNIIATLPGQDTTSSSIYMVGAHYDSLNDADPSYSPGACDNGGGVAIVLELARIMSQYTFNHTLIFAFWNNEEGYNGRTGSLTYAHYAKDHNINIILYENYDSSCYDPDHHYILDIMYNDQSHWISEIMTQNNWLYNIDFSLTYNVHGCGSDHSSFWALGYTAVMTHEETHGYAHTQYDTIDKVSTSYAKKNGQLGLSTLATLAGARAPAGFMLDNIQPIADAGQNQTVSVGALVTFDGSRSTDNLGIAEYLWSFIDTTPKSLNGITPTYTFYSTGNHTVLLNITDFAGNYATDTITIIVNNETINPIAYSGMNQTGQVNKSLTFDASGSSDNTGIVKYEWDFGDGSIGVGKIVTHAFSTTGTFTVTLVVQDASGNTGKDTSQVIIRATQSEFNINLIIILVAVLTGIIIGIFLINRHIFKK